MSKHYKMLHNYHLEVRGRFLAWCKCKSAGHSWPDYIYTFI